MSREIKFRAWETSLKEMIRVDDIDFRQHQINTSGAWRLLLEVDLMQYTGIRDKNGVEIYEGDIVKKWNGELSLVSFREGSFSVDSGDGWIEISQDYNRDSYEVIGNIYDHPELLESNNGYKPQGGE